MSAFLILQLAPLLPTYTIHNEKSVNISSILYIYAYLLTVLLSRIPVVHEKKHLCCKNGVTIDT